MNFHSKEAFQERMKGRPLVVGEKPEVFYHLGCFNNWRAVAHEQMRLLAFVDLKEIRCCVVGTVDDAVEFRTLAASHGVQANVVTVTQDNDTWEHPSIVAVWDFAKANPHRAILYFHSKGVTAPKNSNKVSWRHLMAKHVIAEWRENLELLHRADMVGINWQESKSFPHYSGNFWMARCDWLRELENPRTYRHKNIGVNIAGHPWNRMHVEMWIGSRPWHHMISKLCRNTNMWSGQTINKFDASIPGFSYDEGVGQ